MDINLLPPTPDDLDNLFNPKDEILSIREADEKQTKKNVDYFPIKPEFFNQFMQGGVTEGDLIIITGRTGMGKTTLAQTMTSAMNDIGIPSLWFSYEVTIGHLWSQFKKMGVGNEFLGYCPLKITNGTIEWLDQKIKEGILKFNTKAIFIDHLGFLMPEKTSMSSEFNRNYSAFLGDVVRQIKGLAIKYNLIVFLIAHVRKTKELGIEDIADSSKIAQEADFVFMIDRESKKSKALIPEADVFTENTKITMVKNRRTGINKSIVCRLVNGRFMQMSSQEEVVEV